MCPSLLIEVCAGEDTMTGDGGEYLRAEDLRELGDDSLSGQFLDGMSYFSHNLDRYTHLLRSTLLFQTPSSGNISGL